MHRRFLPRNLRLLFPPEADSDSGYADATASTGGSAVDQADAVKEGMKRAGSVKSKEAS